MADRHSKSPQVGELRSRAEAKLDPQSEHLPEMSPEEVARLLHELRTHQIELEMQNEELRRAQSELIESRDEYSDLYDFAPVGYLAVTEKGLIVRANLTAAKMLGVERARLLKRPLSAFVCADDQDVYYQHRRILFETRASQFCEFRMRKEGGNPFWASIESVVAEDGPADESRMRSVVADVSQRKRAEEALYDANRRLSATLESITDAFVSIDRQWRYVYVNDQACRFLRKPREELLDSVLWEVFPDLQETPFHEAFVRAREEGVVVHVEEFYAPLNAWFSCRCFPASEGLSVYFQDVTDRKRADAELEALNERLEEQVAERTAVAEQRAVDLRRLAAKLTEAEHRERKRLASLLHDDLQQLLLAAKLRLGELGRDRERLPSAEVEAVTEILDACMETSRELTVQLSPPLLSRGTLYDVLQWLGEWLEEKHGLSVAVHSRGQIPPLPEHVRASVFQAVRELLFNAVKHSGTMEARVILSSGDCCVTIQVEDAGKDFDPRIVEQKLKCSSVFGLSSVRERIEALRGRMNIEAMPSGGACFRLTFPVEATA